MDTDSAVLDAPASPHELVLELARADSTDDPFGFRFVAQTYLVRQQGGAYESAVFPWSAEVLDDLAALQRVPPDPMARQRLGERLRAFLDGAGWDAHEQRITAALAHGPVYITLRSSAAELYALPWELLTLRATGQHLGELRSCLVRYEWPGTRTATPTPDPPRERGRILLAYSAAGGAVPAAEHLAAIRRASHDGHHRFTDQDVLAHVSLARLREALAAPGEPVSVLHVLCHGGSLDAHAQSYGLVWNASGPDREREVIDAGALRQVLAPHAGTLRLVVLSACHGGTMGAPGNHLGSVAQALHRIGIPAVIASRTPLSTQASITLTRVLYERLLVGLCSLEDAFLAAQAELADEGADLSWAALQLHARAEDGRDHRPVVVRPYRGLAPFTEADRRFFVGRDAEIEELVTALQSGRRMLALVGPSGAGKSSLVLAGLVPRVREGALGPGTAEVRILRPGVRPCRALAAALADDGPRAPREAEDALVQALVQRRETLAEHTARTPAAGLVLVVDEFEELLTQAEDPAEATAFVANLLHATSRPDSGVRVVLTLRADFLARCQELDRELCRHIQAATWVVRPMGEAELRAAIVQPAARVGLQIYSAVVDALLRGLRMEPASQAGNLPLLQFALEALWEHRQGSVIGWPAWEAIDGLRGVIAQRADQILSECTTDEQCRLVRDLFVRLIQLGQGTEDTRRYALRAELESIAPGKAGPELQRWIAARLITADEDEVWVVHEVVIREWGTLRRWLAENREVLLVQQELARAAQQWHAQGRSRDDLWRGGRLRLAMELGEAGRLRLAAVESAFLDAAAAAQRAEIEAAEAARQRELERARVERRRARLLALGTAVVAVVVSVLAVTAWTGQREARRQRAFAEDRAMAAHDASLTMGAREQSERGDARGAAQFLLEVKRPRTVMGWVELAQQTLRVPPPKMTLAGHRGEVIAAEISSDGRFIMTASSVGLVRIWPRDGQGQPVILHEHEILIRSAALSADGERVVLATNDTALVLSRDGQGPPVVLAGHTGTIFHAAFSPDGRHVVTSSADQTARVWPSDGQGTPVILAGHTNIVHGAAFSPDGRHVVTRSADRTARVWRSDGQGTPVILAGHTDIISAAAFSPDGRNVVTASYDGMARVWRSDGKDPRVLVEGRGMGMVYAAVFSPDGKYVATGSYDRTVRVWRSDGQGQPTALRGHEGGISAVAFSPDSQYVLSGSIDGIARIWRSDGHGEPTILRGHERRVSVVGFSPDGTHVITGSSDGTAHLWANEQDKPIMLMGNYVASSADGRYLVITSAHGTGVWSIDSDDALSLLAPPRDAITSAVFSRDNRYVALMGSSDSAQVWRSDGEGAVTRVPLGVSPPRYVAMSPDGEHLLITAPYAREARLVRRDRQGTPVLLPGPLAALLDMPFSPDGQHVMISSSHGTVKVWRVDGTGTAILELGGGVAVRAAFSPDDRRIVTVTSPDNEARLWNADGSGPPVVLGQDIVSAAFSPDGKHVATVAKDGTVHVWRTDGSGTPVALTGHGSMIMNMEFSRDGQRIVTASADRTARVWRIDGKDEPIVLLGHEDTVHKAAFSPDGMYVVTASHDRTVRVWRIDGTEQPLVLRHDCYIAFAAVRSDGERVVTACNAGPVRVWTIGIDALTARLHTIAGGCLPAEQRQRYLGEPGDEAREHHEACERVRAVARP